MQELTSMNWYERVPKVELHLHLEGAIPLDALWGLVQKYGQEPQIISLEAMVDRFQYQDFSHFIETWVWKNQFLREYEDFTWIAEAVAKDLLRQNIHYVEAFYSPPDFVRMDRFRRHGLQTQPLTKAIRSGLERVPEIEVALIADVVRDFPPQQALQLVHELSEVKEYGVIGIGLGGSEQDFPPDLFNEVFESARRLGFHTTAHAGEAAGSESVWGALHSLKTERIGHATRAQEDAQLVDYLADRQVPLEMCPLSNVCTGVVPSIEMHPIRRYFEQGLLVTLNTDDPLMFGNSLAQELHLLHDKLGFSFPELQEILLNGIRASWLPEGRKEKMIYKFRRHNAWNAFGNNSLENE